MKKLSILFVILFFVAVGCESPQAKGAVVGGAAGSVLGGVIGHQTGGHGLEGAGIGAAVGAVAGAVIAEKTTKKFCSICGRQFDQNLKFCPHDGAELKDRLQ